VLLQLEHEIADSKIKAEAEMEVRRALLRS
jgi:hypothetical protein